MVIVLKSRWNEAANSRDFLPRILWAHLVNNVRPRGGRRLHDADEVSVNTDTGIFTIQWHDSLVPDTYVG